MRILNKRKSLLVILIVAFGVAGQTPFAPAQMYTPLIKVSAESVYLTAGEENQIEITLKNVGSFYVYEVQASLSVPSTTTGISILDGAHRVFNSIRDGASRTYSPKLYVDRGTPLGSYSLTLQVSYLKQYKLGSEQAESTTVQLGVVVDKVAIPKLGLDVFMKAMKLSAGAEKEANVNIENIGSESLYELEARITSVSSQIVVLEGAKFNHESLDPGNQVAFNPTLAVSRQAPLGVYTLTASVSYEDGDGREYIETFALGVTVDSVLVPKQTSIVMERYTTTPEAIHPGEVVDLSLELACFGAKAHELKVALALDKVAGISALSPTLVALGELDPGGLVQTSYQLVLDGGLLAGQYPVTVTLSYLDVDGVARSLVEVVTLSVRGIVTFRLINEQLTAAERGGDVELEADLLLVGTESIRFVSVEVVEDDDFLRSTESEEYIGAVDPDSPIPFELNFGVDDDAEVGDHTLTLRITYTDDLNQEHEVELEFPVTVKPSASELEGPRTSGGFWAWLRRLLGLGP
ncbi:MAG: hypothetical protein NWF12_00050 [Candidatus Bathyarchaeota archaeon]|nr:hypothetical protein [Candidatus Bathyarchaeota archaeon]